MAFALRNWGGWHVGKTDTSVVLALTLQDSPRRVLPCPNVTISRPLKAPDAPQPSPPPRTLLALQQGVCVPSAPARALPASPALRPAQVCPPCLNLAPWGFNEATSFLCGKLLAQIGWETCRTVCGTLIMFILQYSQGHARQETLGSF